MANYRTKNGAGNDAYLKASGAGTDLDPHIVEHLETNSAAIKAALEIIDNMISGSEAQVDIVTSALPTGAATAANQTTIIGHLDGVETLLTSIESMLNTLDNAISGAEMQVDIVSMPAVDTELTTADLDTGAGTDTRAVVGLVGSASGGGQLIPGTAADGLLVNLGANNDVAVSGTVTANLSATDNAVLDAIQAAVELIDNAISGTEMQVDVVAALPAGTNNIGDVDVLTLPAIPAGNNNIGDVDVASIAAGTNLIGDVGIQARTSGGLDLKRDLDLDETELEIKASAGQLFGWYIYNDGAAEVYVKLYNETAANVTVGTTTPVLTFAIPAGSAANILSPIGIVFSAGICAAATTEVADAGTTAPAANQVVANFFYK